DATASGVAPFEPPVEAEASCVLVYTPTLKSVLAWSEENSEENSAENSEDTRQIPS
ncbi:hypothetical protein A2U01_0088390, partial [Trifolium medium]|nr:hypothetical protein [Trifolium medium]